MKLPAASWSSKCFYSRFAIRSFNESQIRTVPCIHDHDPLPVAFLRSKLLASILKIPTPVQTQTSLLTRTFWPRCSAIAWLSGLKMTSVMQQRLWWASSTSFLTLTTTAQMSHEHDYIMTLVLSIPKSRFVSFNCLLLTSWERWILPVATQHNASQFPLRPCFSVSALQSIFTAIRLPCIHVQRCIVWHSVAFWIQRWQKLVWLLVSTCCSLSFVCTSMYTAVPIDDDAHISSYL